MCISGPEFTIEGSLTSASEQVSFQAGFGSTGEENLVKSFEWYLNGEIVSGNDKLFDEKIACGTHKLGLRILSADGWSGIKYVSFQTCVGALTISFNGPANVNEGGIGVYQLIANYANGQTEDVTSQYTFITTEGNFNGSILSIPANSQTNDSRQITITASKAGSETLTKQIDITDATSAQSIAISGASAIYEGSSFQYSVLATYQDGHTEDITNQYTFSASEGTFSGSTLTIAPNSGANDSRQITITATKPGSPTLTMQVGVIDQTIVIVGPESINEGDYATYEITQNQYNLTSQYNFTSSVGNFFGSTLNIPSNTVTGDSKIITITANKAGSAPVTKQVNVVDTTVIQSIIIEGPSTINEGETATYSVLATYGNGATENITSQYTFTSSQGTFTGNKLSIPTNTVVGDTRQISITANKAGSASIDKQVTIRDTSSNPPLGVLVVDIYNNSSLNAIGFIDNAEIVNNHNSAYTGKNFVPTGSTAAQALILASDYINQATLNWRFEFNIQKLVTEYPGIIDFIFFIKGRSNQNETITIRGQYSTKTTGTTMTMSGSAGSYIPSASGGTNAEGGPFISSVVSGADGNYSESVLSNILKLSYNINSRLITITAY